MPTPHSRESYKGLPWKPCIFTQPILGQLLSHSGGHNEQFAPMKIVLGVQGNVNWMPGYEYGPVPPPHTPSELCIHILSKRTLQVASNKRFSQSIRQELVYNSLILMLSYQIKNKYIESKKGCKDQESIQSSTTTDPGYQWESDKLTEDTTNESQEVSPFPAGDHEAHINRREQNIANTRPNKKIKDPQKKYRLGTVSKIFYWRA